MAVIKQTVAFWIDLYRCEPSEFLTWDVDSYIAYIEVGVDSVTGRRVGERLPRLGWSFDEDISYDLGEGVIVEKTIVRRVRGGLYIEPGSNRNKDIVEQLNSYRLDIPERPELGFDVDCEIGSSTEIVGASSAEFVASAFESSEEVIGTSSAEFGISSEEEAFSSGLEEVSSAFEELSSAAEQASSLFASSIQVGESSADISSGAAQDASSEEVSSAFEELSSAAEQASSLQVGESSADISSGVAAQDASSEEVSSQGFSTEVPQESSADIADSSELFVSSAALASSPTPEALSSAMEESSFLAASSPELSQGSSSADLCAAKGCVGGVYNSSVDPGLYPLAGVAAAVSDLSSEAESECAVAEGYMCGFEAASSEVFPGFYQISAEWCCIPNEQVNLAIILDFDADPGEQEQFYGTPGSNPHPLNQETELSDFNFGTSSSSAEFPTPNRLTNIAFTTGWPKDCCLEDGVSTIEVYGDFTGAVTEPLILTYSEFISDTFFNGYPTFNIENPALPSMTRLARIVMTIDDCECSSSSGGA